MKAFPSTTSPARGGASRPALPRAPVIVAAALFITALVIGLALLVGSVILTQSIRSNIERSSQLLPRLSDLRAEVYSLHADTEAELNSELPRYVVLQARRESVADRLNEVRSVAPNTEEYQTTLQTVEDALRVFDLVIGAFQNENPAPGRQVALLFEMRRSFQTAETELAAIYDKEETNYLDVTANTTSLAGYLLVALLVVGFMITVLGGALAFTLRQAARREAVLASGRLQVAAEVGAAAASLLSLDALFSTSLDLITKRFGYLYAAIFLLDEKAEYAVLRAATGETGVNLMATGHKVLVGSNSTVGFVTFNNRPRVYSETQRQTEYFKSELIASTRSELAVPLRQANRVIGVLDVQSTELSPFTDDDIAILQTLADQLAVAIGNAAEFTREQERARQLAALTQASAELTGPQISFNSLLESIVQQSQQLIQADDIGVWLPAENVLELKASASQPDQVGRRLLMTEGISGQVFTTSQPLRIDDYPRWSGRSRSTASAGIQSAMAMPLMWQGDPIGALTLTRSQVNRPFTADDERMARLFASQAAAAIQNVQLLQETQDRVNELYTLNQIGQAIAAQTDLRGLFEVVRQEVMRAVRTKTFYIALYDPATQLVQMPYSFADGEVTSIPAFPLGPGLTSVVIKNRQPLLIRTAEEAAAFGAFVSGDPSRSYLGVPIMQRDEVVGVLAVQDQEKQNAYSDTDTRLLLTVAAQVGLAIQNLRLLEETRQRVIELSFIAEISQTLTTQASQTELIQSIGEKITRLFNVRHAYIALYDSKINQLQFPYFVENGQHVPVAPVPLGEGLTSIIVRSKEPLLINRDAPQRLAALGAKMTGQPAKSFLGAPIIAADNVIGVISVQDPEREGLFAGGELGLLNTIAANVAAALENARLFAETQRSVQDLTVVNTISEQIIQQTDLKSLSEIVVREITKLFGLSTAYLMIHDRVTNLISTPAIVYQNRLLQLPPFAFGEGFASTVLRSGQPLLINQDLAGEAETLAEKIPADGEPGKSYLGVPIYTEEGAIGVLAVQDQQREGRFAGEDLRLLTTLAGQISLAIQSLSLLSQTRRRAEQLAAAAEVGRAAISILNPDDLIVRAADLIRERFDLYYAAIFLVDEEHKWANLHYATGEAGQTLMERKHRLEIGGKSMVGAAVSTRKARIALDVGQEAVRFANPLLPDTHSEMALPILVGDSALGALDVQSTQYNAFSQEDITVLQTMTDQIAVAIQNARLYRATEQRVRMEQLINRVSAKLRRAVDADSIVATTLSELQQVLGARRVTAKLGPEQLLRAEQPRRAERVGGASQTAPDGNSRSASAGGNGHGPNNDRQPQDGER